MVQRDAYAEIQNAIKTLLGLEQYEIALKYLPEVSRRLRAELKKLGSSQAGKIVSDQDEVRDAVERLEEEQQRVTANKRLLGDEMEKVVGLLRANAPAAQLQARRDEQERAYNAALDREKQARGERRKLLGGGAYRVMFAKFLSEVEDAATGLRERGQLPAPLKRQFVDELLESKTCICGTKLLPGDEPHEHVSRWRAKAGLAEVEGAWQQLQGRLKDVADLAAELPDRLRKLNGDMATAAEEARQASEIVSDVSAQIKKLPAEDAQLLEDRRSTLERRIDEAKLRLHDIERELKDKEERAAELRKSLAKVEIASRSTTKLMRRSTRCTTLRGSSCAAGWITGSARCSLESRSNRSIPN
jgi:DNA sulfur modification protein DndD